ncbi:MAG: hypothetical protein ACLQVD_12560 [Capsulimonadaceae bacterium]
MPETFDISQQPNQPDLPSGGSSDNRGRGTGTAADDVARIVFYVSAFAAACLFGYLMWGLFGGAWANPGFSRAAQDVQHRYIENIGIIVQWLRVVSVIGVLALIVCTFRDEGLGYVLAGIAAVLYLGLPFVTENLLFNWTSLSDSAATTVLLTDLQSLWWIFGVPSVLFVIWDIGRRIAAGAEMAAIQRANLKYGSSAAKQRSSTQKQKFLGRCWELPYCRDQIRVKCPIYIRRRGPCWWYKEGCMCEERIVLQAVIASDWKDQANAANQKLNLTAAAPKTMLTATAKRDRCRKCIIYNEHQRQKYKLLSGLVAVGVTGGFLLNLAAVQGVMQDLLGKIEAATSRFQMDPTSSNQIAVLHGSSAVIIDNVLIFCLGLVIVSQALRLVEYVCFSLKL